MRFLNTALLGAAVTGSGLALFAGPASSAGITVRQPNGATIQARIFGDEFQGWIETQDGYTIVKNVKTGVWEYGVIDPLSGRVQPSGHPVNPGLQAPPTLERHLKPVRDTEREASHLRSIQEVHQRRRSALPEGLSASSPMGVSPLSGTRKLIIILVNFSDRALTTTASGWNGTVFQTGSGIKSLRQFYLDNSFNTLDITPVAHTQTGSPVGIVTVTIATANPNYGFPQMSDLATEMAWLNLALAQAAPYVDFAALDTNGDGDITTDEAVFYFIPAGYESATSAKTPNIWAHAWGDSGGLTADTKTIKHWAMNGELNDYDRQLPMGVMTHELGHSVAGLPDLYDTSGSNFGLGAFSLMADGSWGADTGEDMGTTPVSLDAWSRQELGWTTPVVPSTSGQLLSLGTCLSGASAAVRLENSALSTQEYFLVEYRDPSGWDRGIFGVHGSWWPTDWQGGLLVLHVDSAITNNQYVAGSHQMVMPEHANNAAYGAQGRPESLFYAGNNALFTPGTLPSTAYYSGASSGLGFTSASAPGLTMTFNLFGVAASISPLNYTALTGATLPFTATVSDYLTDGHVNWTVNNSGGTFTPAQTGSGVATSFLASSTAGTYTLTATPVETPSVAGTASLTLVNPASVNVGVVGSTGTVSVGDSVTFTASVTPLTDTSVTWTKSNGAFGTQTATTTVWSSSTPGTFTVTATSAVALGRSGFATVTVVAAPTTPMITVLANATTGTTGLTASIPAQAGSTYVWTITGGTITAGQGTTSITFTAGANGSLSLGCTVTNPAGKASTPGTATVAVVPAPTTPVITAPASAAEGAAGLTASIPAQAGSTYLWTITGGTITAGQGTTSITFTAGAPGSLSLGCTVTNAAGMAALPGSVILPVLDLAAVTVDHPTATLVSGQTQALVGSTNVGTILWTLPSGKGTLSASSTASGAANTYTAPANLLNDITATITLTNSTNSAKTATSTLTVKTLDVNRDSAFDLQDILALALDWGTNASRSRLSGGSAVGNADLNLLLASLGF